MIASWHDDTFRITCPLWGKSTGLDIFFGINNRLLNKHASCRWLEIDGADMTLPLCNWHHDWCCLLLANGTWDLTMINPDQTWGPMLPLWLFTDSTHLSPVHIVWLKHRSSYNRLWRTSALSLMACNLSSTSLRPWFWAVAGRLQTGHIEVAWQVAEVAGR